MSEEHELPRKLNPPDLTVLESRLKEIPLPASSLDRDQLLYIAGWESAKASLSEFKEVKQTASSPIPVSNPSSKPPYARRFWPAATGFFATLATVLAIMLMSQATSNEHRQDLASGTPLASAEDQQAIELSKIAKQMNASGDQRQQSLTAQKNKSTQSSWLEEITASNWVDNEIALTTRYVTFKSAPPKRRNSRSGIDASPPATNRDLLRTLAPISHEQRTDESTERPIWNWIQNTFGETI